MEEFEIARAQAAKHFKVADHLLSVTYQVVKDPKLLLTIIENLHQAQRNTIKTLLSYERLFKRIPPYRKEFEQMFQAFSKLLDKPSMVDKEILKIVRETRNIIREHETCPVEFRKKDKLVMCSSVYDLVSISPQLIKSYISKTKVFIDQVNTLIAQNERPSN